jgi:pyruvate, water dikinase
MTLQQLGGCLLLSIVCPLIGALPLADLMLYAVTGKASAKASILVDRGLSVRYLIIAIEVLTGIVAIALSRLFFPAESFWELFALLGIVMGRYWSGRGGGIIAVLVGVALHDWAAMALIIFIITIGLAIFRSEREGKKLVFVSLGSILSLQHAANTEYVAMAISLAGVLWWSDRKIPTQDPLFSIFFQNNKLLSLDRATDRAKIGRKADNLARLKRWGHNVVDGWIVFAGDDLGVVARDLRPSIENPLIVRSSILDRDLDISYRETFSRSSIIAPQQLENALIDCLTQDDRYRVAILVQQKVNNIFSGTVFSRDPLNPINNNQVVVSFSEKHNIETFNFDPDIICLRTGNDRDLIISRLATLAREIETLERGIPQEIDWIYDGLKLWIVDARAIDRLQPLWTRSIIEHIVSRNLRPLTWSIYRSSIALFLSENLTAILGKKVADIDFQQIAILHHSRIYLNDSLLSKILTKLGLSLDEIDPDKGNLRISNILIKFFFKWKNISKTIDFFSQEWHLERDFFRDRKTLFDPILRRIESQELLSEEISETEILTKVEDILLGFNKASYYYLLVSLSLLLRREILGSKINRLEKDRSPEEESIKSLAFLAASSRKILAAEEITINSCASLFAHLAEVPEGENILQQFDDWLDKYGYLGEVPSDLATPRWRDSPRPAREIFTRIFFDPHSVKLARDSEEKDGSGWRDRSIDRRLDLKGEIITIYQQLLANLRWNFLALEKKWLRSGLLLVPEDIFLLKFREIQRLIRHPESKLKAKLAGIIERRRQQVEDDRKLEIIPKIVYGYPEIKDT